MGKQLVGDDPVMDVLRPSRLNQGSLCNPEPPPSRLNLVKLLDNNARKVSQIIRQWKHCSTGGHETLGLFGRER